MVSSVADEEELASDPDELEYDEQASIDESEDSGSEFQVSDEEVVGANDSEDEPTSDKKLQAYAEALEEEGIDADDILLNVAVQESLESSRRNQRGASNSSAGSSKPRNGSSAAAALRAAAAERRMTKKAKTGKDVDDEDFVEDSGAGEDDDLEVLSDVSDEPVKSKGKGKAKAKAKPEKKKHEPVKKVMTMTELRKQRRAAAREARADQKRWKGLSQVRSPRSTGHQVFVFADPDLGPEERDHAGRTPPRAERRLG